MRTTSTETDLELRPPAVATMATRLPWLFRHMLRLDQQHPLLVPLKRYRGVE